MADRQELGEVGAYLLFTGFTILVFPVAGPYILYKNWNGYAERLSWIPGVSSTGGKLSGFAAFVYVFVGIAVVGSAAVGVSGAGLVPAVEAQPGGGGTGSGGGATTLTPAPVGTSTENLVDVDTATPSGPSEAELRAERQRYEQFGGR